MENVDITPQQTVEFNLTITQMQNPTTTDEHTIRLQKLEEIKKREINSTLWQKDKK